MAHRARRARARRAGRPDGRQPAGRVRCRAARPSGPASTTTERRLLQLLTEGRTNAEIAAELERHRGRGRPAPGSTVRPAGHLEPRRGDLAGLPRARRGGVALMAIRARVDRHKCIGAGNCITLAPTAFDWLAGDYGKSRCRRARQRRRGGPPRRGVRVPDRRHHPRGRRRAPAVAAARQDRPGPARPEDVHVHRHRRLDEPRRGARRRGLGDDAALAQHGPARGVRGPRRRGDLHDRRRVLRQLRLAGPGGGGGDRDPAAARRAPLDAGLRARRSGSGSMPPMRRRSAATSTARASTRRPGSPRSAAPARSSRASRRSASRTGRPSLRSATLKGLSEPIEVVNVDWR